MEVIKYILTNLYSLLYKLVFKNKTLIILGNPYGNVTGHIKCCYYLLKSENLKEVFIVKERVTNKNELRKVSFRTFILLLKAKSIIYTHNPTDIFPFIPKGVKKINIWHGMPIKPIGYNSKIEQIWIKNKIKNKLSPYLKNDLLIVNSFYWVNFFSDSWRFPKNRILPLGSLVSAYLNKYHDEIISELSKRFSNKRNHIIFAPTFRNDGSDYEYINKTLQFFSKLTQYDFIVKLHPNTNFTFNENYVNIIFPNNIDLFDLFLISDLLITDYSSIFYEYLNVKPNCILFQTDKKEYEKINGKLNPVNESLKIYYAQNIIELNDNILLLMAELDKKKQQDFVKFDVDKFIKNIDL
ncbi:CDP-glycerol glycerophosphotransferase family protein [uncultured Polaribacter sp.]|uniref:CDP-glycerol glycerophosphotransferase family protein n=1 Tax=uncultured Polaribacter sp. TaxID=174711 RepID=UPI00260A596F|nr:CDP-glycerol glycerophosphotransferase family protein [uncultured Polaribacter sp.]